MKTGWNNNPQVTLKVSTTYQPRWVYMPATQNQLGRTDETFRYKVKRLQELQASPLNRTSEANIEILAIYNFIKRICLQQEGFYSDDSFYNFYLCFWLLFSSRLKIEISLSVLTSFLGS